jgi:hypothetical protein
MRTGDRLQLPLAIAHKCKNVDNIVTRGLAVRGRLSSLLGAFHRHCSTGKRLFPNMRWPSRDMATPSRTNRSDSEKESRRHNDLTTVAPFGLVKLWLYSHNPATMVVEYGMARVRFAATEPTNDEIGSLE